MDLAEIYRSLFSNSFLGFFFLLERKKERNAALFSAKMLICVMCEKNEM